MQSQCPHCLATLNTNDGYLQQADGGVRCAQCQTVFDDTTQMVESPDLTGVATPSLLRDTDEQNTLGEPLANEDTLSSSAGSHTLIYPDLLEESTPARKKRHWLINSFLLLSGLALCAGLVAQLAYLKRQELVQVPSIAPYIHQACQHLPHCNIAARRALDSFHIENRRIYAHPNIQSALVMSATIRNNADFTQPFPAIMVSMSNIRGQEVAARLFQPNEYLDSFVNISNGIAANQSISLSLQLADPGNDALAFELAFH